MAKNMINWWDIKLGKEEADAVAEAIKDRNISQGILTKRYEEQLAKRLDMPYAVCTTSGSMALLMAHMVLGLKPGDEVIIPNRTFIATAHAVLMLGGKAVLVDSNKDSPLIDVSAIEEKITENTKGIVPVHLNGRGADMSKIQRIAKKHSLYVVEDSAQAFLSKNPDGFLGTQSEIGCFSTALAKIISTGQGGFLATKDEDIYEKLKLLRTHGVPDTQKNYPYDQMGFNFRFTDILASMGMVQLAKAREHIDQVTKIYLEYEEGLEDFDFIDLIPVNIKGGEVPLWVEVICKDRNKVSKLLAKHGIGTRFSLPGLNRSPHLKNPGEYPNSDFFSENGLCLPCGPGQSMDNIREVLSILNKYG